MLKKVIYSSYTCIILYREVYICWFLYVTYQAKSFCENCEVFGKVTCENSSLKNPVDNLT